MEATLEGAVTAKPPDTSSKSSASEKPKHVQHYGYLSPSFTCMECSRKFPADQEREYYDKIMGFIYVCADCYAEGKQNGWTFPKAADKFWGQVSPDDKRVTSTKNTREIYRLRKELKRAIKDSDILQAKIDKMKERQHARVEALKLKKSVKSDPAAKAKRAAKKAAAKEKDKKRRAIVAAKKKQRALNKREKDKIAIAKHRARSKAWRERQKKLMSGGVVKNKEKITAARQKAQTKIADKLEATRARIKAKRIAEAEKRAQSKIDRKANAALRKQKTLTNGLSRQVLKLTERIAKLTARLQVLTPELLKQKVIYKKMQGMTAAQLAGKSKKSPAKKAAPVKKTAAKKLTAKKVTAKKAAPIKKTAPKSAPKGENVIDL